MEYNAGKNRYPHIKPSKLIDYIKKNILPHKNYLSDDHCRVLLRELAGSGLDYINASFINVRTK